MSEFEKKFKEDQQQSSRGNLWPLTSFPVSKIDDKSRLKSAIVLMKRFAEMLLFKIYDPATDASEETKEGESTIALPNES